MRNITFKLRLAKPWEFWSNGTPCIRPIFKFTCFSKLNFLHYILCFIYQKIYIYLLNVYHRTDIYLIFIVDFTKEQGLVPNPSFFVTNDKGGSCIPCFDHFSKCISVPFKFSNTRNLGIISWPPHYHRLNFS